jgi:hypothetical protein
MASRPGEGCELKRKYIGIIASVTVLVVVVLLVTNPFGGASNDRIQGDGNTPPNTSNWISPGKFYIEDYEPGSSVELLLQVHNGNPVAANFTVDYRHPDTTLDGYARAPSEARQWVWISHRKVTLDAYQTLDVTIRLGMPSSGNVTAGQWEYWIGVIDQSQTGIVQTESATRVLVTMK